ncbi:unnamed protein product [Rhizopus microsporus]
MSTQSKRPRQQDDDVDYVDSVHSQRIKTLNEGSDEEIERKVKALCRYVLACEYKKINIRRENINKIITPDNKRIFNTLLEQANQRLRTIFGYELQEAILKDKNVDEQHQYDTQTQAESSTQRRTTGGGTSGVYILRNIMKEHFILPDIVKRSTEDYINTGVLYVILALLFIHEREMDSNDLFEHLDRLKVTRYGQEPLPDRDQLMDTFVKNQYIRKTKLDEQDGEEIQYRFQWGPRAYTEIPAQNMVEFISSFYNVEGQEKTEFVRNLYQAAGYELRK